MKCTYCDYIDGWDPETNQSFRGTEGDFFEHPVKMERNKGYHTDRTTLYGCPNCFKTFIYVH